MPVIAPRHWCPRLVLSGLLPGEAEDLWEHGHGHEAAEPPGQTSQGQAVRPRAAAQLWAELHKKIAFKS